MNAWLRQARHFVETARDKPKRARATTVFGVGGLEVWSRSTAGTSVDGTRAVDAVGPERGENKPGSGALLSVQRAKWFLCRLNQSKRAPTKRFVGSLAMKEVRRVPKTNKWGLPAPVSPFGVDKAELPTIPLKEQRANKGQVADGKNKRCCSAVYASLLLRGRSVSQHLLITCTTRVFCRQNQLQPR